MILAGLNEDMHSNSCNLFVAASFSLAARQPFANHFPNPHAPLHYLLCEFQQPNTFLPILLFTLRLQTLLSPASRSPNLCMFFKSIHSRMNVRFLARSATGVAGPGDLATTTATGEGMARTAGSASTIEKGRYWPTT